MEAAADELEKHGDIAVWMNNAMASVFAPTWEITAEEFRRVTEVTYLGVVYGFTESLRCELMHEGSGVRVTMVQLPALNTPQAAPV